MKFIKVTEHCLMLSGNLTFQNIKVLTKEASQLLQRNSSILEVNLSNVKEVDSATLLLLLTLWRQTTKQKQSIQFTHLPEQLKRLIGLSNLEKIMGNS
jgi:anti-anti-sigma factor